MHGLTVKYSNISVTQCARKYQVSVKILEIPHPFKTWNSLKTSIQCDLTQLSSILKCSIFMALILEFEYFLVDGSVLRDTAGLGKMLQCSTLVGWEMGIFSQDF